MLNSFHGDDNKKTKLPTLVTLAKSSNGSILGTFGSLMATFKKKLSIFDHLSGKGSRYKMVSMYFDVIFIGRLPFQRITTLKNTADNFFVSLHIVMDEEFRVSSLRVLAL